MENPPNDWLEGDLGTMLQRFNPPNAPAPFSRYSQAVVAPEDYRWLYIAGQVGCDRDRNIAEGFERQAELAWTNLLGIMTASGFAPEDLVKVTLLLTNAKDVPASRVIRDRMLGPVEPALLFEVEGIAARPGAAKRGGA